MRGNSPSRRAPTRWILHNFRRKLNECLKKKVEHNMYEFQIVIHSVQTWKKLKNWNENRMNISCKENTYWKKQRHRNLFLERQSFTNLFITRKSDTIYNGEPQPLKVSQPTNLYLPLFGVYLYYFSVEITLWNKPKKLFLVTIKR